MSSLASVLSFVLYAALCVHIVLIGFIALRLWKGKHTIDRLMAADILGNLTLAVMVICGMIHHQNIFLDVALGLAALGFITIISYAKYITDKKIF